MKKEKNAILKLLNQSNIVSQIELESFDSGAFIIDFEVNGNFYCIQLWNKKFGWSKIEEDVAFSTIPDNYYEHYEVFEKDLKLIICIEK